MRRCLTCSGLRERIIAIAGIEEAKIVNALDEAGTVDEGISVPLDLLDSVISRLLSTIGCVFLIPAT